MRKSASIFNRLQKNFSRRIYYIDTRYPVHWPAVINKEEAQKAKEAAEVIRQTVYKALSQKPIID